MVTVSARTSKDIHGEQIEALVREDAYVTFEEMNVSVKGIRLGGGEARSLARGSRTEFTG